MSATLKSSTRLKGKRRPGDPWVSKNRVLNGPGKSKRNCPVYRNPNFDTDETKLLIQLWGDPKVQRELITTHKKHLVISQLSAKMEEYGYCRSPEEITTRIKNMKCFYNRLKKEMESCKGLDPSWRHYAEMDAIMTRPIFSVRPNEVPAPSLKYLLEQEQEKRKERKRKAEEEGNSISDSDEDIADILAVPSTDSTKSNSSIEADCIEPDAELELEIDDVTLAALQNMKDNSDKSSKSEKPQNENDQTLTEEELAIKMEMELEEFQDYSDNETNTKTTKPLTAGKTDVTNKTINITEDENLLVPKVEPIDVDQEYENIGKQQQSSTTTQMSKTLTHLADILNQPAKTQNLPTQTIVKFAMPTNSVATTISSSSTSIPTQSKISVVSPTILMSPQMTPQMPPKSSNDSNMSSRQVRLGGNIHALLAASGSRTTVTNANGVKFLLVNTADQNRGPPVTTSSVSSTLASNINLPTNQTNVQIIPNSTQFQQQQQQNPHQQPHQQQQQQQQQPQQQQKQQQMKSQKQQASPLKSKESTKRSETRQEYREQFKKRDLLGIKTTLLKLLKAQEDSNELQSERLAIERERLQFERTIADKFLNIFEQNQKMQQQQQQQQQQQHQQQQQPLYHHPQQHFQIQQRPTTSPHVFTTNNAQNITSTGQIMIPPKLLITTMVPTSAQTQSVAGAPASTLASKVLTSANFGNLATKQNHDVQLLIPKEEPKN